MARGFYVSWFARHSIGGRCRLSRVFCTTPSQVYIPFYKPPLEGWSEALSEYYVQWILANLQDYASKTITVPKKDLRCLAPGSLPRHFTKEIDTMGCGSWVVRKEAFAVFQCLTSPENKREKKFILYGADGNGKTIALSQIVWFCAQNNWICVHVPSVSSWTYSPRDIRPSIMHENLYDQPSEAIQWLKNLKTLNSENLKRLMLTKDYQWSKRDSSKRGDSLLSVVDAGLVKPLIATEIVRGAIEELVEAAKVENVILAIDEFNAAYNPTMLKSMAKQWIEPDNLSLVQHTKMMYSHNSPVAVVAALSRTRMRRHHVQSTEPQVLLGLKGMEDCGGFHHVMIPPLSYEEFNNYVKHQYNSGWYIQAGADSKNIDQLWALTIGNPKELQNICAVH